MSELSIAGTGYTYNVQIDTKNHIAGLGYDPSGSGAITADGINNYSYDGEQRLLQVNGATTYLYDPEGRRVAKQLNGAIQEQYLYDPDGTLTTTLGPDGKLIRGSQYGGGLHLADYTAGTGSGKGRTELRLMDSLGTLFVKLDGAANVLETCSQNAFGESLNCTPGLDFTETHFTDKLRDPESSLDYSGARYYNSTLGRFTVPDFSGGADPIPYADLSDPQSLNLYSYAGNNPLGNGDPDGHKPCADNEAPAVSAGAGQPAGSPVPCEPKITVPPETVKVHADLLNLSVLGQRVLDFASSTVQAAQDYLNAPRDPSCLAGAAAGGAAVGSVGGGVAGGLAGGAAGTLVEPGGGTFVGGAAGAAEGSSVGGQAGFSVGTAFGFVACSTGGGGGGGGSRGSTGRGPKDLKEQLAAEQAVSNPKAGKPLPLRNGMSDSRWPGSQGWVKMSQNINGVEVHYNYNTVTQAIDDIKVK